jgi:hypothetical protein
MTLDHERLRDQALKKLDEDKDKIFANANQPSPDPNSPSLKGMVHYIVQAVVEEISDNAEIESGIEVEDSVGDKIGETRQGPAGSVS